MKTFEEIDQAYRLVEERLVADGDFKLGALPRVMIGNSLNNILQDTNRQKLADFLVGKWHELQIRTAKNESGEWALDSLTKAIFVDFFKIESMKSDMENVFISLEKKGIKLADFLVLVANMTDEKCPFGYQIIDGLTDRIFKKFNAKEGNICSVFTNLLLKVKESKVSEERIFELKKLLNNKISSLASFTLRKKFQEALLVEHTPKYLMALANISLPNSGDLNKVFIDILTNELSPENLQKIVSRVVTIVNSDQNILIFVQSLSFFAKNPESLKKLSSAILAENTDLLILDLCVQVILRQVTGVNALRTDEVLNLMNVLAANFKVNFFHISQNLPTDSTNKNLIALRKKIEEINNPTPIPAPTSKTQEPSSSSENNPILKLKEGLNNALDGGDNNDILGAVNRVYDQYRGQENRASDILAKKFFNLQKTDEEKAKKLILGIFKTINKGGKSKIESFVEASSNNEAGESGDHILHQIFEISFFSLSENMSSDQKTIKWGEEKIAILKDVIFNKHPSGRKNLFLKFVHKTRLKFAVLTKKEESEIDSIAKKTSNFFTDDKSRIEFFVKFTCEAMDFFSQEENKMQKIKDLVNIIALKIEKIPIFFVELLESVKDDPKTHSEFVSLSKEVVNTGFDEDQGEEYSFRNSCKDSLVLVAKGKNHSKSQQLAIVFAAKKDFFSEIFFGITYFQMVDDGSDAETLKTMATCLDALHPKDSTKPPSSAQMIVSAFNTMLARDYVNLSHIKMLTDLMLSFKKDCVSHNFSNYEVLLGDFLNKHQKPKPEAERIEKLARMNQIKNVCLVIVDSGFNINLPEEETLTTRIEEGLVPFIMAKNKTKNDFSGMEEMIVGLVFNPHHTIKSGIDVLTRIRDIFVGEERSRFNNVVKKACGEGLANLVLQIPSTVSSLTERCSIPLEPKKPSQRHGA